MNQLSENIGSRIGALELSDVVAVLNDGALENAAGYIAAVPPTTPGTCMPTKFPMCSRIDDGVLENTAGNVAVGQTYTSMSCPSTRNIFTCPSGFDDATLEESAGAVTRASPTPAHPVAVSLRQNIPSSASPTARWKRLLK